MSGGEQPRRWIVLHADDYGMNSAVNEGILRSFREGILTSTSLLANAPAAEEACAAWPKLASDVSAGTLVSADRRRSLGDDRQPFDLGIHLNLTQGRPLSSGYPAELLNERGQFPGIGPVFRRLRVVGSRFRDGVRTELQMQIERMLAHGIHPTHLNGHQYVEMMPGVSELIPELAAKYSIRIVRVASEPYLLRTVLMKGRIAAFAVALIKRFYARRFRNVVTAARLAAPTRFFGTSHAGIVDRATLLQFVRLSSSVGCTEIGLHPASAACDNSASPDSEWFDPLSATRSSELSWLCHPSTCDAIASNGLILGRLGQID